MEELVFTPAAVLDLLTKIDELKDYDIGITETLDGSLQLQVGDSIYELESSMVPEIDVSPEVVEEISDANTEAYQNLEDSGEVSLSGAEPIQSGILKEMLKSLALGGMLRLSAKILK